MRITQYLLIGCAGLLWICGSVSGAVSLAWPDPGWTYAYTGDAIAMGSDTGHGNNSDASTFNALDGTWDHTNNSDEWTGGFSASLGGVRAAGGIVTFEDPGSPADPDPDNRKMYFAHDIGPAGAADNVLDIGVTLSFRSRVTPSPLATPLGGRPDGYILHDNGKGNFGIRQKSGGLISFSLAVAADHAEAGATGGLLMNHLNGTSATSNVDTGEAGTPNLLALADPTTFHEFWITIVGDTSGGGTHRVSVYLDGSLTPSVFHVTAGTGGDYPSGGGSISRGYLGMGTGATNLSGAFDADFFAWMPGVIVPTPEPATAVLVMLAGACLLCRGRSR